VATQCPTEKQILDVPGERMANEVAILIGFKPRSYENLPGEIEIRG
jgi:hypothetical protein